MKRKHEVEKGKGFLTSNHLTTSSCENFNNPAEYYTCQRVWTNTIHQILHKRIVQLNMRHGLEYQIINKTVSVVWISDMNLDDFYHSGFSDCCLQRYCYIESVSADMSSGLLQVFVELWRRHRTSNYVLYLIHRVSLFWFR